MKTLSYFMVIICPIAAMMYYMLPGGSLPTFMPGFEAGSTRLHKLDGLAVVTGAVLFLLIGLSTRPRHGGPRSPNEA
jgi:hypothetical protein